MEKIRVPKSERTLPALQNAVNQFNSMAKISQTTNKPEVTISEKMDSKHEMIWLVIDGIDNLRDAFALGCDYSELFWASTKESLHKKWDEAFEKLPNSDLPRLTSQLTGKQITEYLQKNRERLSEPEIDFLKITLEIRGIPKQ